ncbi:MAG: SDR family NAD(P)-dependent oxidoreductase, partial [Sphingomonas sp.]
MYFERLKLTGRRALVTGGAAGIGLACAQALAEMGAHVTIADRDETAIAAGQAALSSKGYAVERIAMDVTDSARVTTVADQLGAIDILVNNAGIARSETPAEDVADEHWLNVLDVNL